MNTFLQSQEEYLFQSQELMQSHHSSAKKNVHPSSVISHKLQIPLIGTPWRQNSRDRSPTSAQAVGTCCCYCWICQRPMFQRISPEKPNSLLITRGMEIYPIDSASYLVEADIVKSLEARPVYLTHTMIWHQEFLLPAHEHVFAVCAVLIMEVGLLGLLRKRPPGREARPVLHVLFIAGAPVRVPSLKSIFRTDYLTFEKCCECSVFGC